MVHVIWPRPFQGWSDIRALALATINLRTGFEISISTHYEDLKGDKNVEMGVVWVVSCQSKGSSVIASLTERIRVPINVPQ